MQELLYNNSNSDFFSFALDRPTDYLFDYGYYGDLKVVVFCQQLIPEGGFKSKLNACQSMDDHFEWRVYDLELD
jgi:hypothetical protein